VGSGLNWQSMSDSLIDRMAEIGHSLTFKIKNIDPRKTQKTRKKRKENIFLFF